MKEGRDARKGGKKEGRKERSEEGRKGRSGREDKSMVVGGAGGRAASHDLKLNGFVLNGDRLDFLCSTMQRECVGAPHGG